MRQKNKHGSRRSNDYRGIITLLSTTMGQQGFPGIFRTTQFINPSLMKRKKGHEQGQAKQETHRAEMGLINTTNY
jgi:hypothetical protein